jgi:predicted house-cleaning noncanonical NTP pyrophosphatase (MazG superfamily)
MYKDLSSGIKISISRSISTVFELYMTKIGWEEDLFKMEDFMEYWKNYIEQSASWFDKVPMDVKESYEFHEEIAKKINATIEKMLTEPVSEELVVSIEILQEILNTHFQYGCKAEALYVESRLKEMKK